MKKTMELGTFFNSEVGFQISILIEIDADEFRKTCYIMKKWQIVIGL